MRMNRNNLDLRLYFIVIKVISSYVVRKSVNIFLILQFFAFVLGNYHIHTVLLATQKVLVENKTRNFYNALSVVVNKLKLVLGLSRGFVARKQRRHRRAYAHRQSEQHLRHSLTGEFIQIYNIYNFNILDSLQVYAAWEDWFKHDLVTNPGDIFSHDLIYSDSMTSN